MGDKAVRDIQWIDYKDQKEFGEKYAGKVLHGIIDQVISGSTLRIELIINKNQLLHKNVVVNIAGINAPKVPRRGGRIIDNRRNQNQAPNAKQKQMIAMENKFGAKAKEYCEDRLLGQVVDVRILFVTGQQIIFAHQPLDPTIDPHNILLLLHQTYSPLQSFVFALHSVLDFDCVDYL